MNTVTIVTQRIIEKAGEQPTWEGALYVFASLAGMALVFWVLSR